MGYHPPPMDLKSGYPFWTVKNGLPAQFPPLLEDVRCDVAIVGGGITGALVAHALAAADLEVVVIEQRDIGWGSTAASTALLQYEIDNELAALAEQYGEERAVAVYRGCAGAIGSLEEIALPVAGSGFARVPSLYLASRPWHAARLRREGELRQRHGFALEVLERGELRERYGIGAPAALLTAVAGHVDPYRLAVGLLDALARRGVGVYDRTAMESFETTGEGVLLRTSHGATLRAKNLVLAAGYESQRHLKQQVATNHSSYALVTEPLRDGPSWLRETLVWETARPYLYLRPTADGRLIFGGNDDHLDVPAKRDAMVGRKCASIRKKVARLLPGLTLEPAFAWGGTFAETPDSLPYFGPHRELGPRVHFAMAYGGNGIVFSVLGAEILRARIRGENHKLMQFLSFDRLA